MWLFDRQYHGKRLIFFTTGNNHFAVEETSFFGLEGKFDSLLLVRIIKWGGGKRFTLTF